MNFRLVQQWQQKAHSPQQTCRLLGVSCSGYYAAVKRWQRTPTVLPEKVHLKAAFVDSGKVYGSRRLKTVLQAKGFKMGRYRIRGLMKANQLCTVWKRKFVHTTNSNHGLPCAEN